MSHFDVKLLRSSDLFASNVMFWNIFSRFRLNGWSSSIAASIVSMKDFVRTETCTVFAHCWQVAYISVGPVVRVISHLLHLYPKIISLTESNCVIFSSSTRCSTSTSGSSSSGKHHSSSRSKSIKTCQILYFSLLNMNVPVFCFA